MYITKQLGDLSRKPVRHPGPRMRRACREHGTLVVEDDVLQIEGDNKPGSLAKRAHELSRAKINIEHAYCAPPPDAKKSLLIFAYSGCQAGIEGVKLVMRTNET